jgi:hypothetical protein
MPLAYSDKTIFIGAPEQITDQCFNPPPSSDVNVPVHIGISTTGPFEPETMGGLTFTLSPNA